MTNPTDAEIRGLAATGNGVYQDDETAIWEITDPSLMKLVHDALAKWGQPAQAAEPVAWQYRSMPDVGGMWFDCTKERADLCAAHPERWEVRALYTTPQPTQAQAGAVPQYRLLVRGRDTIQADDEFLSEDGVTWRKDQSRIFFGCMYESPILLPARRVIKEGGQHGTE